MLKLHDFIGNTLELKRITILGKAWLAIILGNTCNWLVIILGND